MTAPDDLLSAAAAAARASADPGVDDGAATRLRLRTSLAGARPRASSRRRLTLIAAIFGTFIGSTAFALAVHAGWEPPWRASSAPIEAPPPPAPVASLAAIAPPRGRAVRDTPPAIEAEPLLPEPEPIAPAPEPVGPPSPRIATATPASPPVSASPRIVTSSRALTAPPVTAPPVTAPPGTAPPVTAPLGTAPIPASPAPAAPRIATASRGESPSSVSPGPVSPGPVSPGPVSPGPVSPGPVSPGPASPGAGSSSRAIATSAVGPSETVAPAKIDDELAAYRVAHTAHFRGTDPVAALAAWDGYLARFPNGRLAPEARYDRALVLVKLSRWSDARAALRPFATTTSGYHQREAAELLAAIANR